MVFSNAFQYSYLASHGNSSESIEDQYLINQTSHPKETEARPLKPVNSVLTFRLLQVLPWFLTLLLISQAAPAIEDGVVEYYDTDFENEFAHKTKFRGPPTPEIEAAWNQIWNLGGVEVPLDGPAQLGKPSENLVHINSDEKRGYSGMLEVFHQLHCLNLIRQYTWRDYYNDNLGEWLNEGDNHQFVDLNVSSHTSVGDRMHVDHCIETLRLQLMCNADLTPMLVLKDDSVALGSKADFNVHHKCRRWDRLVAWQRTHTTDKEASGLKPS
ncbi:hypothetical protein GQX73_g2785 [Xylaria multiplex]|uniref:Tat pathway signal sequence n=1 Tax=Xylaria multiplex TaxID=323545 RepID=A0A7C8IS17_9PEZI|nr:hypothetical protein GQX73_g2785 [Xylaria multiplex]